MFNYGNKSFVAERISLEYYAKKYDKPYEVIDLPFIELPPAIEFGIDCNPYVAQRNLIFSSIAMAVAENRGYKTVLLGAVNDATDYDGSPTFIDDLNYIAQNSGIKISSATARYNTEQILTSLMRNKVDISHLWSCDSPTRHPVFCGGCAKCVSALRLLRDYYSENKLVVKYYYEKYKEIDVTKALNNEFRQDQEVCERH